MRHLKLILAGSLLATACVSHKYAVTYTFPDIMKDPVRSEYLKMWEKGRVLYDMNCSRCHSKKMKKGEIVPDFEEDQLRGYELRIMNQSHESALPDEQVTEEELGLIMVFLRYKTRNPPGTVVAMPKGPHQ